MRSCLHRRRTCPPRTSGMSPHPATRRRYRPSTRCTHRRQGMRCTYPPRTAYSPSPRGRCRTSRRGTRRTRTHRLPPSTCPPRTACSPSRPRPSSDRPCNSCTPSHGPVRTFPPRTMHTRSIPRSGCTIRRRTGCNSMHPPRPSTCRADTGSRRCRGCRRVHLHAHRSASSPSQPADDRRLPTPRTMPSRSATRRRRATRRTTPGRYRLSGDTRVAAGPRVRRAPSTARGRHRYRG